MYSEEEVIRRLNDLARHWPAGYMLFSWSGSLCLLKVADIPSETRIGTNGHIYTVGTYRDAIVETFPGITNDGGDPD